MKASATAAGAAAAGAVALALVFGNVGLFTWVLSGVVGYGVTDAVLWGSEGNRAAVFRRLAYGAALVAVLGGWLLSAGVVVPGGLAVVTYLASAYGAKLRLDR